MQEIHIMNQQIIIEDIKMAEIEDVIIDESPSSHSIVNSSHTSSLNNSFDSSSHQIDSGYLSMTPQSITCNNNNINNNTCNNNNSPQSSRCKISKAGGNISNQKSYWLRSEKFSHYERRKFKVNVINNNPNNSATNYSTLNQFNQSDYNNSSCQEKNQYQQRKQQQQSQHQLCNNSIVDRKLLTHTVYNISKDRNDFKTELREYRTRTTTRKYNPSSAALTPASNNKVVQSLLLTPLSPSIAGSAAACSFMACEPIEQEIANKLVIVPPHSTPCNYVDSSELNRSSIQITCSPKTSKTSPASIISIKNKFNKLKNNPFAIAHDIKRKRLDFSLKTNYYLRQAANITSAYTGKETVDILSLLGEKTNHPRIIRKIFAYLKPQDLCAISMVSRSWRRLCLLDSPANVRRLQFINCEQNIKENVHFITSTTTSTTKTKKYNHFPLSPKIKLVKRSYLMDVQNTQVTPTRRTIPSSSPPVSPSKIKFHSYVKASRTLSPSERLFRCPKCFFACRMDMEKNAGTCTREGCGAEFCTICSSMSHTGACKTPLLSTPTKRKEPLIVVGSKQSKRNLRRL